jgi:chemotaxis signal transduction protein
VSKTTELVNAGSEFRGIAYFKNEPISVYDLRRLFGLMSNDEFIRNVADIPGRITEHEMYAQELRDCVDSALPFKDETDANKCNFGKWLYDYKSKAPSLEVRKELLKVEPVHEKFHSVAKTIKDFVNRGRADEAANHIEELNALQNNFIRIMGDLNEVLIGSATELNIVLQLNGKKIGLIIDNADSVEDIDEIQELPPSVAMTKYIRRLGLSKKEKQIIFILEAIEFNAQ